MSTLVLTMRRHRRRVVVLALVAAVAVGVVTVTGELGPSARAVGAADLVLLAIAAACEITSYVLLGSLVRRLARDATLSRAHAIRIGLIAVGLGGVLPAAPLPGLVLAARELESKGVAPRRTFATVGLAQWYATRALIAFAAPALLAVGVLSAVHSRALRAAGLLAIALVLIVAFVVMGLLVGRPRLLERLGAHAPRMPLLRARADRITAWCATWIGEVRAAIGDRANRARLLATAIGATAADAACFTIAFRATGVHTTPRAIAVAYAITMLAMFVPLLPSGIGTGEAAVAAFLHSGANAPIAAALGGMLVYRALSTLMPAVAGAGVLAELRVRRFTRSRRVPTSSQ